MRSFLLKKIPNRYQGLFSDVLFLAGCALVFLIIFALLRAFLIYKNFNLVTGVIPAQDIFHAFLIGIRFDLVVASYCLLPLSLGLLLPQGLGKRKFSLYLLTAASGVVILLGLFELEFYYEFHDRFNNLAFQYLKEDPATVTSMLWHGFPVIQYLLLWLVIWAICVGGLIFVHKYTSVKREIVSTKTIWITRIIVFVVVATLLIIGGRGTLRQGPPLRWGDAYHSQYVFANHLALNGTYTLIKAGMKYSSEKPGKEWLKVLPQDVAIETTRQLILTPQDALIQPQEFTIKRDHTPINKLEPNKIKNIVIVMMESFSAEFVGALGHTKGDITPEFNKLTQQGLLFDNFFSNGTHTHQGMFVSISCFPNLPGYEYLMQQPEGRNMFSGLPVLLGKSYNNLYVYNGDFAWDNQEGFFRNQGMTNFVGRHDYENPKFSDPTWGVSDEDMFNRAILELDKKASEDKPFYAILQTLSNHTPYALPTPLPVEPVTGFGKLSEHLTAMKYADWALGQFFEQIKTRPYYKDTLFVLVGDHGFGVNQQLTEIDLLRFHVPLLLIGPGVREAYGATNHTVGTQVDLVPTVMGLLGKPFQHQCWGRDLLALPKNAPGFGIIKPSGGSQTIAILKGQDILVKLSDGKTILGNYDLYPATHTVMQNDAQSKAMEKEMDAYIQSAMQALLANKTGA